MGGTGGGGWDRGRWVGQGEMGGTGGGGWDRGRWVGQGEVGGTGGGGWGHQQGDILMVAARLGALKEPWLAPGGPPPTLTAWTGLENTTLILVSGKELLSSEQVHNN